MSRRLQRLICSIAVVGVAVGIGVGTRSSVYATGVSNGEGLAFEWGYNNFGELGNGSTANSDVPVAVSMPPGIAFTSVSVGTNYSLALDTNGNAWAWGDAFSLYGGSDQGQLGNGSTSGSESPVAVVMPQVNGTPVQFTEVAAGAFHSLALDTNGDAWAWGENYDGELGTGPPDSCCTDVPVAVNMPSGKTFTEVSNSAYDSLALASDGTVYAWGENDTSALGDGTSTNRDVPVQVCAPGQTAPCTSFLSNIVAVAAGTNFSLALSAEGTVYAWGVDYYGELGDGVNFDGSDQIQPVPVQVCAQGQSAPCSSFLSNISAISAGGNGGLALASDGTVYAWGYNGDGEYGNGTTAADPQQIGLPDGVPVSVSVPSG